MAHKIKFHTKPHENKDGTISETRKDYIVTHKKRRGRRQVVATVHSLKAANEAVEAEKALTYGDKK